MLDQAILVLTNLPDASAASMLGRQLVERNLAACVNQLPGVRSIYRWQGQIEEADEVTLLIKTTQSRYTELEAAIVALHPYEMPEIIAVPISGGFSPYLQWIAQVAKKDLDA